MSTWTNTDYEQQAAEISRSFWAGQDLQGSSLSELATKVARDNNLNPEQIRRLCRATNKIAFAQKHAEMSGTDRSPDFTPVDSETVLSTLHAAVANNSVKVAEELYPELPNEYARKSVEVEKVAEAPPKPRDLVVERIKLAREVEDLGHERRWLNVTWEAKLAELHELAKRYDFQHDDFEKNAVALFGGDALPELNTLRTVLGRPTLEANPATLSKLGHLQETWLGAPTDASNLLKAAVDARTKFMEVRKNHQEAEARLAALPWGR